MNKEQSSKIAEAELDLNNALVNADISNGYEAYLALFDHFYDENVEVASDSNPDPLVGKARVLPIIFHFLLPLHVMAEIGGLSARLRYTPLFSDKREEQHADWSLDLVGATGRSVMMSWSSARRWKDAGHGAPSPELPDGGTPRCAGNGLCNGSVARRHHSGEQIRAGLVHGAGEAEPGILQRPFSIEPALG